MRTRPDVLVRTAGLSPGSLRLLIALEQCCRANPACFYGNGSLAEMVGCSTRRVRSGLAELERAGWIRRDIDPVMRHREEIVMIAGSTPSGRPATNGVSRG